MKNTVELSNAQAVVILYALKNEHARAHPDDKADIAAIHDHVRIQCTPDVQRNIFPLVTA